MKTPVVILRGYFFLVAFVGILVSIFLAFGVVGVLTSDEVGSLGFRLGISALGFVLGSLELCLAVWSARIGRRFEASLAHPRSIYRWGALRIAVLSVEALAIGGMPLVPILATLGVLYDVRSRQAL